MRQDHRTPFELALLQARASAYAPGEFVGQESFMTASEIRALALPAGIGPRVSVLDVGCGTGGPGRFLTRELNCDYLGVDFSPSAIALARHYAAGLPCRYAIAHAPPLPAGRFDVVLLLEAMLAIEDKDPLHRAVAAALAPGGRFAFTLEEGAPLTAAERAAMPDPDTVWLSPIDEVAASLGRAGLLVTSVEDHSAEHRATAQALIDAYTADAEAITAQLGRPALDDILAAHRLWVEWLDSGRVRKFALVGTKAAATNARPWSKKRAERLEQRLERPMLVVAALVIPAIVLEESHVGDTWHTVASVLNWAIWLAFLGELVAMLAVVRDRRTYLVRNPLSVVIVLLTPPFLPSLFQGLRALRLLRLLRLLWLLPMFKLAFSLRGLQYASVFTLLVVLAGAAAFENAEPGKSYFDGVYWAVSTMTTVGYGDELPTTVTARVIAMALMIVGIGYFAVVTGAIAERFIERGEEEEIAELEAGEPDDLLEQADRLALRARELALEVDALRAALSTRG